VESDTDRTTERFKRAQFDSGDVPGPDGKYGFAGNCLPKDSTGLAALADSYGVNMEVLKTTNKQNKIRRPDGY